MTTAKAKYLKIKPTTTSTKKDNLHYKQRTTHFLQYQPDVADYARILYPPKKNQRQFKTNSKLSKPLQNQPRSNTKVAQCNNNSKGLFDPILGMLLSLKNNQNNSLDRRAFEFLQDRWVTKDQSGQTPTPGRSCSWRRGLVCWRNPVMD